MTAALAIVIPSLNEAAGIVSTLRSLQSMRRRGVEIVVADGGSADGTAALAAPYTDQVLHTPRGRAAQMNAGAAATSARVLLFMHADCVLPARADERILGGLTETGRRWGRFDITLKGNHPLLNVIAF